MTDNVRIVSIVVAIAAALTAAQLGYYWAQAEQAPVEACERLDDQELVAECLAGVAP